MPLKRNTSLMVFLLCSLALWCKSTSFLSPSQKPQSKGKSPRVSRQAMEEFGQPQEGNHITISTPFEFGITMREENFEEYVVLQKLLQQLTGNTAEKPPQF